MICPKLSILFIWLFLKDNITHRDLFDALRHFQRQLKPYSVDTRLFLYNSIAQKINNYIEEKYEAALNCIILRFVTTLNRKWSAVNRSETTFIYKNQRWLYTEFIWRKMKIKQLINAVVHQSCFLYLKDLKYE